MIITTTETVPNKEIIEILGIARGSVEKYTATKEEILFAKNCLKASPFKPMYSRVDIVYDNKNKPSLSELELIEPELWFRNNTKSATLLAEEVFSSISSK